MQRGTDAMRIVLTQHALDRALQRCECHAQAAEDDVRIAIGRNKDRFRVNGIRATVMGDKAEWVVARREEDRFLVITCKRPTLKRGRVPQRRGGVLRRGRVTK